MEIRWTDHVKAEEVLNNRGGEEYLTYNNKEGRLKGLDTSCIGTAF
jgi:hypothetical protein